MPASDPKRIPLSLRWALWLEHVPRSLHRPLGCLVAIIAPLAALAFLIVLVGCLVYALPLVAWHFLTWANSSPIRKLGGVSILVAAGIGAYALRRASRLFYAWIEVAVAITGMWLGIGTAAASKGASLSLAAGGIYLLVRGFDNMMQGRQEARERHAAKVAASIPEIAGRLAGIEARDEEGGPRERPK